MSLKYTHEAGVCPSFVRPSSVRCTPFSKIFFSEAAWPINAKFYVEHPWERGTRVNINGRCQMTKMAAMLKIAQNLKKNFFSNTTGQIALKLGMQHQGL